VGNLDRICLALTTRHEEAGAKDNRRFPHTHAPPLPFPSFFLFVSHSLPFLPVPLSSSRHTRITRGQQTFGKLHSEQHLRTKFPLPYKPEPVRHPSISHLPLALSSTFILTSWSLCQLSIANNLLRPPSRIRERLPSICGLCGCCCCCCCCRCPSPTLAKSGFVTHGNPGLSSCLPSFLRSHCHCHSLPATAAAPDNLSTLYHITVPARRQTSIHCRRNRSAAYLYSLRASSDVKPCSFHSPLLFFIISRPLHRQPHHLLSSPLLCLCGPGFPIRVTHRTLFLLF
jgi:hypothetical protein